MQQIDTYTRKLLAPLLKHIASQPTLNNTKINLPLTYIPEPITTLAQILSTALAMQNPDNTGLSSLAQDSIAFALRQVEEELAIVTEQTLIAQASDLAQKYQLVLPLYSEQHNVFFFILLNKRA